MKRFISFILAFVLAFSPVPFFAEETEAMMRPEKSVFYIIYTPGYGASGEKYTDGPYNVGTSVELKYASDFGFEKEGYYCTGWSLGKQGSIYTNEGNGSLGSDMQYYVTASAQWAKEKPKEDYSHYKIVYNSGSADLGTVSSEYVPIEESIILCTATAVGFEKSGYTFNNWNICGKTYKPGETYNFIEATSTKNSDNQYTVYATAKWKISGLVELNPVVIASGYCGNESDGVNLKWSIGLSGLLTISGTGEMRNYSDPSLAPWNGYLESITAIEIEDGVTSIGDNAFSNFENIEGKVDFPESIEYIGENSFRNCGINEYHFFGDAPFVIEADNENASFDVSEDIIYFVGEKSGWKKDSEGKWNGYNIESLYYAKGYCGASNGGKNLEWTLTENGTLTISGKGKMTDYDLDNKIAPWTKYPDMLKTLVLEEGITNIGDYAFYGCIFTGNLVIPDSVTVIGEFAFGWCSGFTGELFIPNNVKEIEAFSFAACVNFTGNLKIPKSTTIIRNSAFTGCSGFDGNLVIPDSVTTIEDYAFHNCSGFTGELKLPNSITTIGNYVFYGCSSFAENSIVPKSVMNIGNSAFDDCGIDNYYFEGDAPVVSSATAEYPSFDEVDIIHYYSYTNGWELDENGKWNGYNVEEREAGTKGTFSPNGAEGTEFSVIYNEKLENGKYSVTLPDCYFVKTDSYFDSWKINGKFYSAGEEIEVSEDFSAVPKWKYFGEKTEYVIEDTKNPEIFVEPKGKTYYIALDPEQPYKNIEIISNGIVEAKYIEFDPKTMSVGGAFSAVYKVYDKDKKINIANGLSYEEAFAKANEYNSLNFSASGVVVAENYINIIEVKVGENYSADYKEGNYKINATLDGVELSGKITVISDVYLKYVADTLESSNEVNADAAFLKENFIKLESAKMVKAVSNVSETSKKEYDYIHSINIDEWPDKTVYCIGDIIDLTGMKVTAVAYKLNEETRVYEPFETDVTDLCWAEPSVVTSGESQNISVYLKAPSDQSGKIGTFKDSFRITVTDEYGNDYELGEIEPIYENLEMNYGKDPGYSAYLDNDQAANEDTPATVFPTKAFRLVSGGKVVVNGDNFVLEIPEVSENQNGINFYHETTPISIKFLSDTIMQSDYTIYWNLGMSYYELREHFGLKVEEDDVVSYYIYNDNNECLGKYSVDYMTADIEEEASFLIKEKAGKKLGGYTVSIEPPEGSENVPEMNNIASGYCGGEGDGTNLTWVLTADGTLTISGNGKMADYWYEPWEEYYNVLKKIVIKEGVTTIGECAFYNCFGITGSIIIPNSVTNIGYRAFYGCSNLTGDIIIPKSVTSIGGDAFIDCGIDCYIFEGDAPEAGWSDYIRHPFEESDVIYYNWKTKGWTLDSKGDWRGYEIFVYDNGKTELKGKGYCGGEGDGTNLIYTIDKDFNLVISGKGKMKDYYYYTNSEYGYFEAPWVTCCSALQSLTIENGITSIGNYAFGIRYLDEYNEYGFKCELVIPNSIKTIGNYAFENCSGLTGELKIPASITTIGSFAFSGCSGLTGELKIPASVTTIGSSAFSGCSGFTGELKIPDSVTTLGSEAFKNCTGFTGSLVLPRSITYISNNAFYGCSGFNGTLTIPRSVTRIGYNAFESCSGFTGDLVIPENVVEIEGSAFKNCTGFNGKLHLPEKLNFIYSEAFYNCSGLTGELILPNNLWEVFDYAFKGCYGFTGNLVIPQSVSYIGAGAFEGCTGFTGSLIIHDNVYSIGAKAFSGCTGLDGYLTMGARVETIGEKAFENCNLKGKIVFSENLTKVADNAFSSCDNLREFEFKGEAPIVVAAEFENRSFAEDSILYYTHGWEYWTSPKWNGYSTVEIGDPDAVLKISSGMMDIDGTKKVSVTLSENSKAAMIQFAIKYNPDVLKLVSCSAGGLTADAAINCEEAGIIHFAWDGPIPITAGGKLLELVFETAEEAEFGETYVEIDMDEKFVVSGTNMKNLYIDIVNGIIKIVDGIYGDLNGDSEIDIKDAYFARLIAAKLIKPTDEQILFGDVDLDGRITAIDANIIRKFVVKIITKIPVEM